METVVTRFSEKFRGGGGSRHYEETLQLPDFIKDFISDCNFSFTQRPFAPWGGAHHAGLPRRARCGAVEAPEGLMPDGKWKASFALGWEERSGAVDLTFTPLKPCFGPVDRGIVNH